MKLQYFLSAAIMVMGGFLLADPVSVSVDFSQTAGPVKCLHAVNNAPIRLNADAKVWEFEEAGIPYMRTHDSGGRWGGGHFIDIPNIFPDFNADENDPKSYDFAFSDAYLKPVVAAGTKIYYRLGVTIENNWTIKAYNIFPPKDFAKWARICEHVIRHYNEGWADGFKWNVEYWEIWNEPENPPLWRGTREQYFELYRITSNHLKKFFPDIKIGGYGSCGLYAVDDPIAAKNEFVQGFLDWFKAFLVYVTAPETKAPLDFFSWHMYFTTDQPDRVGAHARYVRKALDEAGLTKTESHFNEWNFVGPNWKSFPEMRTAVGGAHVAAALCELQTLPVDLAMYYDADPTHGYCGLFRFDGAAHRTPSMHVMRFWNRLYRIGTACVCSAGNGKVHVAAAAKGNDRAVLIVNNSDEPCEIALELKGAGDQLLETRLVDDRNDGLEPLQKPVGTTFTLGPRQVMLSATPTSEKTIDRGATRTVFAGQDSDKK